MSLAGRNAGRRQTYPGGATPAAPDRDLRSGSLSRTLRFSAHDAQADGQTRQVELTADMVVLRRSVAGIRMALRVTVNAYAGVAVRRSDIPGARFMLVLEHRDPGLTIPLEIAADAAAIQGAAEHWSLMLGIGMVAANADWQETPPRRRRRCSAVRGRRPAFLVRRKAGSTRGQDAVHRNEREIIARR